MNVLQNPQRAAGEGVHLLPADDADDRGAAAVGCRRGCGVGEKLAAAALALSTTLVLIWLAGRVFRFGMLHTDKAAALRDMMRWIVAGIRTRHSTSA